MSEYSARNFMRVAEVFGKRGTVPDLPPTALYELAAPKTPLEVREEVEHGYAILPIHYLHAYPWRTQKVS